MVRYTGRQKTITGAVNRNQVGLKMSGCPSRVGRSGKNIRFLGRRVNCMYGLCGPTMVNGAPWRTTGRNDPPYCRQRSTACAQAAGGVGHINSPYTRTRVPAAGKQGCTQVNVGANTPWWYDNADVLAAIAALTSYFASHSLRFVLVGESETLATDLVPTLLPEHINHYETGRPFYDTLPTAALKSAVDLINSIQLELPIILDQGLVNMRHIVGTVTDAVAHTLATDVTPYGVTVPFGIDVTLTAYASTSYTIPITSSNYNGTDPPEGCTSLGTHLVYPSEGSTKADTDWVQARIDACVDAGGTPTSCDHPTEMRIWQQNNWSFSRYLQLGHAGCTANNSCLFTFYNGPGIGSGQWYLVWGHWTGAVDDSDFVYYMLGQPVA